MGSVPEVFVAEAWGGGLGGVESLFGCVWKIAGRDVSKGGWLGIVEGWTVG